MKKSLGIDWLGLLLKEPAKVTPSNVWALWPEVVNNLNRFVELQPRHTAPLLRRFEYCFEEWAAKEGVVDPGLVTLFFPGIGNYDAKGNWIGNVANENGWTP